MAKRYRAEHIVVFAVYKKFKLMGNVGRYFKVAFPDLKDAENWIEDQCKESFNKKEDFIVEEMPAIMKAWTSGE